MSPIQFVFQQRFLLLICEINGILQKAYVFFMKSIILVVFIRLCATTLNSYNMK